MAIDGLFLFKYTILSQGPTREETFGSSNPSIRRGDYGNPSFVEE